MRSRRLALLIVTICVASCWALLQLGSDRNVAHAQQSTQEDTGNPAVFHAETRLVLVDTVVTDKKGNYVRDLAQKDFKVWEDGKEQPVTSFSYEESAGSPTNARPHYMVLFFDNSTMDVGDQAPTYNQYTMQLGNLDPDKLTAAPTLVLARPDRRQSQQSRTVCQRPRTPTSKPGPRARLPRATRSIRVIVGYWLDLLSELHHHPSTWPTAPRGLTSDQSKYFSTWKSNAITQGLNNNGTGLSSAEHGWRVTSRPALTAEAERARPLSSRPSTLVSDVQQCRTWVRACRGTPGRTSGDRRCLTPTPR